MRTLMKTLGFHIVVLMLAAGCGGPGMDEVLSDADLEVNCSPGSESCLDGDLEQADDEEVEASDLEEAPSLQTSDPSSAASWPTKPKPESPSGGRCGCGVGDLMCAMRCAAQGY